jgi:Zn-dependent protease with chaperone function
MIQDPTPSLEQTQSDLPSVAANPIRPVVDLQAAPQTQPGSASISVPWLWFWLVTYILYVPAIFNNFIISPLQSIFFGDGRSALRSFFTEYSVRGVGVVELVPYIIVMLGIIFLLFPKQRAARLERKYRLKDIDTEQLPEIRAFLECYAPKLKIKVNLAQMDQYAFVYPTGYRSFAIAIFGPLARLWRQDPEAAKAVLLHEVAHYRSGDGHIQGTGSLFTSYLRSWLLIFLVSLVLPLTLNLIKVSITAVFQFFREGFFTSIPGLLLGLVGTFIPSLILTLLSEFLGTLSIIFLPLMGIWIAEINADFYAAQVVGDAGAVQRALRYVGKRPSFFIWLLRRMTHPPEFIRRVISGLRDGQLKLSIILMMIPLAYLARILIILVQLIVMQMVNSYPIAVILNEFGKALSGLSGTLLFVVLLFLIWSWLAPRWQSIFTHVREGAIVQKTPYFLASGLTFGLLLVLALFGKILQALFR